MKLIEFKCDLDLSKFIDSMLFDSGTDIASGRFEHGDKTFVVYLTVNGEVSVTYKGETYHRPSEFPEELMERIKNNPDDWFFYAPTGEGNDEQEGDIYVTLNNWYEFIYGEPTLGIDQGDVCEDDISKLSPGNILDEMTLIASRYFGIEE
ncbi:MAG: hypothetical protein J5525_12030 [Lachnospiraceae bacterium]|nr:hypothetical protein [Lachnospiraceae bacterium]